MGNVFLNGLKKETNVAYTANGALAHKTTLDAVLDLFALGGAYRQRTDADCISLFRKAFAQDEKYALKCLFYLRDVRGGGQGERRFFRVCLKWLAEHHLEALTRNIEYIAEYGRWDDLLVLLDTDAKDLVLTVYKKQLALDMESCMAGENHGISLLAKWLPSCNTSSAETRRYASIVRTGLGMNEQTYRKTLSKLREQIRVLEKLMSANRWDEIEFDKIPSQAGMKYRNAFAHNDITKERYAAFAASKETKVNASVLYPYECVNAALHAYNITDVNMVNKYWANLADYINGAAFNGLAIVDTSGSMYSAPYGSKTAPITVALSLGIYCAEKCSGPFKNHFMTFSSRPSLVELDGDNFVEKVQNMSQADWGMSTNLEAVFNLLLKTAIDNHCAPSDMPQNLIIVSDMQYNACIRDGRNAQLFDTLRAEWARHSYKLPHLVFWNVNASTSIIPDTTDQNVSFVSGMSPALFDQILKNLSAFDLMYDKLDSARYGVIG